MELRSGVSTQFVSFSPGVRVEDLLEAEFQLTGERYALEFQGRPIPWRLPLQMLRYDLVLEPEPHFQGTNSWTWASVGFLGRMHLLACPSLLTVRAILLMLGSLSCHVADAKGETVPVHSLIRDFPV